MLEKRGDGQWPMKRDEVRWSKREVMYDGRSSGMDKRW